jgi:hypothetical protein
MAFNGTTAEDLLRRGRYIARWVTDYVKNESGTAQIQVLGYCVYDSKGCKTLFEHKDREVCQKLVNILNEEEANNVRRT